MPISIKTTKEIPAQASGVFNDMEQCIAGVLMLLDLEVLQDKTNTAIHLPVLIRVNPGV